MSISHSLTMPSCNAHFLTKSFAAVADFKRHFEIIDKILLSHNYQPVSMLFDPINRLPMTRLTSVGLSPWPPVPCCVWYWVRPEKRYFGPNRANNPRGGGSTSLSLKLKNLYNHSKAYLFVFQIYFSKIIKKLMANREIQYVILCSIWLSAWSIHLYGLT